MADKKTTKRKKSMASRMAWEIGTGITVATIAAAAGAYLLSDRKTKMKAKKWALAARKEAARKVRIARKLGEKEYGRIVEQAVKRYGSLEDVSARDIMAAAKDLKGEWKAIQAEAKKMAKAGRSIAMKRKSAPSRRKASSKKGRV